MTQRKHLAALIAGALILQGCSQLPQQSNLPQPDPDSAEVVAQVPTRAFPAETLYALLVAEIAGSRERYDIALGNYMQQAHKTRDPGIAARATRIARYLNARQAALNSALLWVELAPEDMEAHFIAASELAHASRLNEALDHSILLLDNGSTPIFPAIAARAAKATDTQREQLLTRYEALKQQHPENTDLLIGTGLLRQQQNQLERALTDAQLALELEPSLIPAAILEAKLLTGLKRPEQALKRLDALLLQYPENKRLRLQYARLLANTDLEKAQEQFNILAAKSPDDPELIFSLALISNERGLLKEAEGYFNTLLDSDKHSSSAHYYLGRIMEKQENYEQALLHYVKVKPGSDFMPALLQSTDIMVRANKLDVVHKRLNNARERFPSQAERFYLLEAEVLSKHMYLKPAHQVLSQGLQQFPASTQLLYSRAMVNEQLNLLKQLEGDLRTILKYDPNNATALNALGYTLADRTSRIDEAYQLISQALQINPDDPAIIDSMGWVQYRMGNMDESLLRLRQAMQAFPDHEIAAHLGEVLWVSGEQEEAHNIWQQGLQLNPKSRIIREVMQRLLPSQGAQQ